MGAAGFMAEAPGYGRMSYFTGSIYWQHTLRDETVDVVERRSLANAFLEIDEGDENATSEYPPELPSSE